MKHGQNSDKSISADLAALYNLDRRNHPERYTPEAIAARELKRDLWPHYTPRPTPAIVTVYFIGPKDGPIKIGMASRVEVRVHNLRLANAYPLEIWATVDGPPSIEREYHTRFAAHRTHGEWFERHPNILAEIRRLSRGNSGAMA